MGDYSLIIQADPVEPQGREIRERGDDAKTEGTKAVWPRSRKARQPDAGGGREQMLPREPALLTSSHWPSKIHS